jgi:AcrR family transcriptional regulator
LRAVRGLPSVIQADHSPELRCRALDQWAYDNGVRLQFIEPGKPIQSAHIESFNAWLREECLNEHVLVSLDDARNKIERWRVEYNRERPHSSLGNLTRGEFAAKHQMSSAIARTAWRAAEPELANLIDEPVITVDNFISKMIDGLLMSDRGTSRPPARARRLDHARRRAMLLQHAMRVFAHDGIGGARHAEIARKARVAVPTVFFYFPTRKALVSTVLEEVARFFLEMAQAAHGKRGPASEVILEHLRAFASAIDTHPDHTHILLEWSTALRGEIWPAFLKFQEKIIGILMRTIRRSRMETWSDRDPRAEDDARLIAVTGYVLVQMKLAKLPSSRIERFLETVVRDTLEDRDTSLISSLDLSKFNVAVG